MNYISTRGKSPSAQFCDTLLEGLAPDGGLRLPETYPKIGKATLDAWRSLSYAELAFAILSLYIDDIPPQDLKMLCDKTYTAKTFRNCRVGSNPSDITPLTTLRPNFHLLGLSNGPTLAFKDVAMQLLGNLFEYVLEKRGESINILGATSGDTGSAAEYALRGKKGVNVFMLSPYLKMSPFQSAQMYSIQDSNIFNIAVRGVFDDAQDIVKAVSNDAELKAKYKIGAVNSINWARIIAQVVYYFKGYFAATASNDERISLVVPTGNFGNICAGHIARMMGLPIERLVLATNENDVLHDFFRTGVYRPRQSSETFSTSSPSMDISKASNFERFVFDLVGRDPQMVRSLWAQLESHGSFTMAGEESWKRIVNDFGIVSGRSTHIERLKAIRWVWEQYGIMIDTHTADAYVVATIDGSVPIVVLETAQPAKFAESIHEALGLNPPYPSGFEGMEKLPQRVEVMDAKVGLVKQFIVDHT